MNKTPFDLVRAIRGDQVVNEENEIAEFVSLNLDFGYPLQMKIKGRQFGFQLNGSTSINMLSHAELFMAAPEQPAEPEPFDLARAQAGEEIMTRDEQELQLLDYDENRDPHDQVVVKHSDGRLSYRYADGTSKYFADCADLVMKPATPKTRRMELWGRVRARQGSNKPTIEERTIECNDVLVWAIEDWLEPPVLMRSWDEPIGENDES